MRGRNDIRAMPRAEPALVARARLLRRETTPAERALWHHLRHRRLRGHHFRRQHPIDGLIADFCCTQARLVIELDGGTHRDSREVDAVRTETLEQLGYHVLRIWNSTPTPEQREAVAEAARALHEARQSRLDADPKLTLTALYNQRPPWLDNLHRALDRAVLAAYGWPDNLTDDELLERLLALNLARAADEERGVLVRP